MGFGAVIDTTVLASVEDVLAPDTESVSHHVRCCC